jgi:hypothetical protein
MTYVHYAVVNETCSICGQGRILIAAGRDEGSLFAICEDCEAEWDTPIKSFDESMATRNKHTFLRYLEVEELKDHPWYSEVLNR